MDDDSSQVTGISEQALESPPVPPAAGMAEEPPPPEAPETAPLPAPKMTPVSLDERFEFLDVLRGCALFGILTANMRGFFETENIYFGWKKFYTWTPDIVAQGLIDTFIQGKFVTLFALMFGIGFAIQMTRSEARGVKPGSFYPRRLLALLMFGLVHIYVIWWGDILASYALAGFALFLFRKARLETVLKWTAGFWLMPIIGMSVGLVFQEVHDAMQRPATAQSQQEKKNPEKDWRKVHDGAVAAYQSHDIIRIQKQKIHEGVEASTGGAFGGATFAMFLFLPGLALWRSGLLQNLEERRAILVRVFKWGLWIGLTGSFVFNGWRIFSPPGMFERARFTQTLAQWITFYTTPALSAAYGSGLALLWLRGGVWRARLHPFAAVGRTALTNYLLQSTLCTTFFFVTGLYGRIGPAWGLVPTVLLFAAQVVASNWWLNRYRYGPMEYLWRLLTYGKVPSMRLEPRPAVALAAPAQ
jgi:uncharacterized protein